VGTVEEPLRVLGDPRVVGRALDREVERHLEAEAARALDEPVEVVEGAELRVDRRVAALRAADRPGASRVAGPRRERVVLALAVRTPDRVDGRQVDDVEAHRRRALELRLGVLEGPARAREELVPRGEARALAVGDHLELPLAPGRVGVVEVTLHEPHQRLLAGEDDRRVGAGCPCGLPRGPGAGPRRTGASRHVRPAARRYFREATSTSWPSLKMSAVTSRTAPTSRFTGYRPPSTVGATASITTVRRG